MPLPTLSLPSWLKAGGDSGPSGAQSGSSFAQNFINARDQRLQEEQWKTQKPMMEAQTQKMVADAYLQKKYAQDSVEGDVQFSGWMLQHPDAISRLNPKWIPTNEFALHKVGQTQVMDARSRAAILVAKDTAQFIEDVHSLYPEQRTKFLPYINGERITEQAYIDMGEAKKEAERRRFEYMQRLRGGNSSGRSTKVTTHIDPATGKTTYTLSDVEPSDKQEAFDKYKQMLQVANDLMASGNASEARQKFAEAEEYKNVMFPKTGTELTFDEGGRVTGLMIGGGGSGGRAPGVTPGMMYKASESSIGGGLAMTWLNNLKYNIKPEHVGAAGLVGTWIVDRGLAQLDPSLADKPRIRTQEAIALIRNRIKSAIQNETRLSDFDMKRIDAALPSSGAMESIANIQEKIDSLINDIRTQARMRSQQTGLPLPDWARTQQEVDEDYKNSIEQISRKLNGGWFKSDEEANAALRDAFERKQNYLRVSNGQFQ